MVARTQGHGMGGHGPMGRPLPRGRFGSTAARASAAVLAIAAGLALSAPAQAQTATTFVSNIGQTNSSFASLISTTDWRAQQFETGSNAGGYNLSEIVVNFRSGGSTVTVALYTSTTGDEPGTEVVALSGSAGAGEQSFTPSSTTTLSASTKYFILLATSSGSANLQRTSSDDIDSGASTGWDIADGSLDSDDAGATWPTSTSSIEIAVKGTARVSSTVPAAPTGLTATADGSTAIDLAWTAPSDIGGSAITGVPVRVFWTSGRLNHQAALRLSFSRARAGVMYPWRWRSQPLL